MKRAFVAQIALHQLGLRPNLCTGKVLECWATIRDTAGWLML